MTMPTSLSDFIITNHAIQMTRLESLVARAGVFPQPHNNTLLIHGSYGTGKTLLASMLPALIEHQRASELEQVGFDYVYSYMGKSFSITPQQHQLPVLNAFSHIYSCGGESAVDKQRMLTELRNSLTHSYGFLQTQYRFYIFDEIDELNKTQADLKSVISSAPPDVCFILTTNHLDRVEAGLVSRSSCIEMGAVPVQQYLPLIRRYYPDLGKVSDDALVGVVKHCQSDWRRIKRNLEEIRLGLAA